MISRTIRTTYRRELLDKIDSLPKGGGRRGHDESRKGAEGCVGVGGVDLLAWCLPADDVSMAERVAMAA